MSKIYEALFNVFKEIKPIGKDQKGYGYNFRGIDDVLNALHPLFKKYGIITRRDNVVVTRQSRVNAKGKEQTEVTLKADYYFTSLEDGSEIKTMGMGEGIDSSGGDKATSMATSNSYKYVIFELFNIATEEQQDSDQVTAKEAKKFEKPAAKNPEATKLGTSFRRPITPQGDSSDDL